MGTRLANGPRKMFRKFFSDHPGPESGNEELDDVNWLPREDEGTKTSQQFELETYKVNKKLEVVFCFLFEPIMLLFYILNMCGQS